MKRLLPFVLVLAACPTGEPQVAKEAKKADEKAEPTKEETKAEKDDALCFKVAGVTEASLQGTVHSKKYDPEKFKAGCEKNLKGSKAEKWRAYYDCVVETGDKSYVVKCTGKSPSTF